MSNISSSNWHLAQANVAQMRGHLNSPTMAGLLARIEEMNALAESSDGFVWRVPEADVTTPDLRGFKDHHCPFEVDRVFYNMSVWESAEHLRNYVYKTVHSEMLRAKLEWIENSNEPALVLWWIPAGTHPTVAESAERWLTLRNDGPTAAAFTLSHSFAPPSE